MKSPLGKGLAALIRENNYDDNLTSENSKINIQIFSKISVDDIEPNPYQPRIDFDEESLTELKNSILEKGIIQPVTVRRLNDSRFQLISGERRLRAAKMAGLSVVPAYILEIENETEMLELALIENIQRDTLNPIEIALGYKRLIEECNLTQDEIAKKTAKDRSTVTNFIRLLKLPKQIQESLKKNEITTGHARAILSIDDEEEQLKLWKEILENKYNVRVVEKIAKTKKSKKLNKNSVNPDPMFEEVERKLRILFGTKVIISKRKNGSGSINLEFYSLDDLNRILEIFDELNN